MVTAAGGMPRVSARAAGVRISAPRKLLHGLEKGERGGEGEGGRVLAELKHAVLEGQGRRLEHAGRQGGGGRGRDVGERGKGKRGGEGGTSFSGGSVGPPDNLCPTCRTIAIGAGRVGIGYAVQVYL